MIPDWQTNSVCFSKWLPERFPELWKPLSERLRQRHIPVRMLDDTRDIWARDYSPVQTAAGRLVKFRYDPDYLRGYRHLITNDEIVGQFSDIGVCCRSRIRMDGGNLVASESAVIVTDKIYRENPEYEHDELRKELSQQLGVRDCLVIPKEPGDVIGHSDGVVRFLDNQRVVMNDYATINPAYGRRVATALQRHGLQIKYLPCFYEDHCQDGISSAVGNYVNFLRVGNLFIVPAYQCREDDLACRALERLCPQADVTSVECTTLARSGGVLNCITSGLLVSK